MITTKLIFDWKNRTTSNNIGPVDLRVTADRKTIYIATGVKVRRSEFRNERVVAHKDADALNTILESFQRQVMTAAAELAEKDAPITAADIKRLIRRNQSRKTAETKDLITWIADQVPMLKLKEGTRNHYRTLIARLEEYGRLTSWDDLTTENLYAFDDWLHRLPSTAQRTISDASVYSYHKCLKAILNRAVLFEIIDRNPYDKLRGKFARGDRKRTEYLTDVEIAAFESIHPVPGSQMAIARDLFVFQLHTGLSYADTQSFDFSEYQQVNGHYVNIGHRVKTDVEYIVQLDNECLQILASYDNTLPNLSNADYNLFLKTLGEAAGIRKTLHSHLARHTFATYMLRHGARIENVAKMLGHTNISQTQRYAKVLLESVMKDFEKAKK